MTKRLHRRSQGTGEIRKMGNVWKIRYQLNGRRVQESSGSTRRADAVRLLNLRLGQIAEGRLHVDAAGFRWADLERIILDEHKLHRSYEKVERHTRRHLHRCFHNCRVQTIDYARLLRYKNDRLAENASPSTVRYELSLIRTGLVVAYKAGLVGTVPPLPNLKVENVKTGFFEPEDYAALLAHLPERVQPVVSFLYYSGWRRNEVLSRQWRHVDFDAGIIQLDPGETKSGKGRTLPFAALPAPGPAGRSVGIHHSCRAPKRPGRTMDIPQRRPADHLDPPSLAHSLQEGRPHREDPTRLPPDRHPKPGSGRGARKGGDGPERSRNPIGVRSLQHRRRQRSPRRHQTPGGLP